MTNETGISKHCSYQWIARFGAEELAGPVEQSSSPPWFPTPTPRPRWRVGCDRLTPRTGVPVRTTSRIVHDTRCPPGAALEPLTSALIRSIEPT